MSRRIPLLLIAALALTGLVGCVVASQGGPRLLAGAAPDSLFLAPAPSDAGLSVDDGFVPVGETVSLSDDVPAIANLDDELRAALEAASVAAQERGVEFTFTDAWRSTTYQQHLFDAAVASYGSEEEASRWVKRADESQHVLGGAVDVATADAMDWLSRFGAEFGLCQIYANEAWHFEYVPGVTEQCPDQLSDSASTP